MGEKRAPFIIGVAGGSASGKKTVCKKIFERTKDIIPDKSRIAIISLENFYRVLSENERKAALDNKFNFDHPDAFDFRLLGDVLEAVKAHSPVKIPVFDRVNHCRLPESNWVLLDAPDVLIIEGIMIFYEKQIRDMLNMKIFVDVDSDTRLSRRVLREAKERKRDVDVVLKEYLRFVKPGFDDYIFPTKKTSDIIMPRGADNDIAIDLIMRHVSDLLQGRVTHTQVDDASKYLILHE